MVLVTKEWVTNHSRKLLSPPLSHDAAENRRSEPILGQSLELALQNPNTNGLGTLNARLTLFQKIVKIIVLAHEKGRFHGNLSPRAVFLGQFGELLIQDWPSQQDSKPPSESQRAEKALQDIAGELTVSSAYLAPERVRDPLATLTGGSDVYALGAILYTMLTLKSPVESQDLVEIRQQILRHEIIPPSKRSPEQDIPFPLEAMTVKALAFDPDKRQGTVADFLSQLEDAVSGGPSALGNGEQAGLQNTPRRPIFVTASFALFILIALTSFFLYEAAQSNREAENATQAAKKQLAQASEREYLADLRLKQVERLEQNAANTLKDSRDKENACIALVDKAQKERRLAEERLSTANTVLQQAKTLRNKSREQILVAQRERANAIQALANAERKLAQNLVLQGRLLAQSQRWAEARRAYQRGRASLNALEEPALSAKLGLWLADYQAPLPLLKFPHPEHAPVQNSRALVQASSDGRLALTGGFDNHLYLWDLDTGVLVHQFKNAHSSPALNLVISPSRPLALSGSMKGPIEVWDFKTKSRRQSLKGHKSRVTCLAFDPGGILAISGSIDGQVNLWNTESGALIHSFLGHKGPLLGVAISPDGQTIAGVGSNGQLCIWDVTSAELLGELASSQDKLSMVGLSPNKELLFIAGAKRIDIWNWRRRALIRSIKGHRGAITKVAFSPNGRELYSCAKDRSLKIWNIDSGQLVQTFRSDAKPFTDFSICEQGRIVLCADADKSYLWDRQSAQMELRSFNGHLQGVSSVDLSRDGHLILTGSVDKRVRLWDCATGKSLLTFNDHKDAITRVLFSPKGTRCATADRSGIILLWDLVSGRLIRRFPKQDKLISSLAFTPDGNQLLFGSQNQLTLWAVNNSDTPSWTLRYAHKGFIRDLVFSPDGRTAYSAGEDGFTRSWNVETGRPVKASQFTQVALSSLSISRDGRRLLVADARHKLRVLDAQTLQDIRVFQGHDEAITALRFLPSKSHALSSSMTGEVKVWDWQTGEELHSFRPHIRAIQSLTISRGPLIATGASDRAAKLIDLSRPEKYLSFENRLNKGQIALAKNPKDAWALLDLGQWYLFRGHSGKAERLLKSAVASGASPRQLLLARAAWLNGHYAAAKKAFQNALDNKEAPEHCIALYQRALSQEADRIGQKPN